MKNKMVKVTTVMTIAILATLAFGTAAFAQGPTGTTPNNAYGFGRGYGRGMGMGMRGSGVGYMQQTLPAASTLPLTDAERAGLLYMREEEKLAHDVYVTLYAKYGAYVFNNISRSESQHMSSVKTLLDRYGIPDPAAGKAVGQFTNSDLQALYNKLVAQGSQSLTEAYNVGVAIENVDIADLKTHLTETTKSDIQRVYNNLLFASQNHLRAFQRFQ
jgi:hypothetical protein